MSEQDRRLAEKWVGVVLSFGLAGLCLLSLALPAAFMGHVLLPVFLLTAVALQAYRVWRKGVFRELRELRCWLASDEVEARLEYLTEFRFWRKSFWKPPRRKDG